MKYVRIIAIFKPSRVGFRLTIRLSIYNMSNL